MWAPDRPALASLGSSPTRWSRPGRPGCATSARRTPGIRRRRAGPRVRLPRRRRPAGPRRGDAAPHPRARHPAGVDRRLDLRPRRHGHLQATGRDARGRKQYRYHARWRAGPRRDQVHRMLAFAARCRAIRARVAADLARPGLPREKVLATVVRLLETTLIRVGNEEYARANSSFGLTTLRDRHVDVGGAELRFEFRGKSGKAARRRRPRPPAGPHRPALPGPARPGAVPVPRRGRRAARRSTPPTSTTTCARSPARTSPPRTSAPGPARCWPRWRWPRCARSRLARRGQAERRAGDRGGGRAARQHAGRLPQVLRPPRGDRRLPRRRDDSTR